MLDFSVKYHNDSNSDNPKLTTLDVANDFTNGKLSFDDFERLCCVSEFMFVNEM